MAKVSKVKEYAARYLKEVIGMEEKQIAKEVSLTVETLQTIFETENSNNANIKTVSSKTDSFVQETAVKRTKNVTIMTEAASQLAEQQDKPVNSKFENAVYRPRG